MVDRAPAVATENPGSMRVINHHDGAVPLSDINQLRKRADVAVHRKDAVGDQQLAPRSGTQTFENSLGGGRVFVREDVNFGSRQPAAVDDAGMVELVGNDVI